MGWGRVRGEDKGMGGKRRSEEGRIECEARIGWGRKAGVMWSEIVCGCDKLAAITETYLGKCRRR